MPKVVWKCSGEGRTKKFYLKGAVGFLLALGVASGHGSDDRTRLVADVSLLLADHYSVDCIQIFRSDDLPFRKVEEIHGLWRRLALLQSKTTTGVNSYERYAERKRTKPWRYSCYKSLKIVSDDEGSRRGFANLIKEFEIKDAVWLLFLNGLSLNFFQYADIAYDDAIVVAVIETADLVLFYEVYRITQSFPMTVTVMGNWTKDGGLALNQKSFYERRSDLQGVVLRAGLMQNWPTTYFKNGKWDGFLVKVWNQIQEMINCTSINIRAEDNLVGLRLSNGSWNGLVGMALRNEIDVIISEIVIDKRRSHVLKFLYPFMTSRFQIYTRHLGYEWQWSSVLKPFDVRVWLTTLAWIFVFSVFFAVIYSVCVTQGLESPYPEKSFTPFKSFLFLIQALCQQGYYVIPDSYTCRILFFMTYAVSGVLIPSYSASLVSSLAQKTNYRSFDSLQDMVADGSYRLLVKENSVQHAFFAHTKDEFLRKAYKKLAVPVPEELQNMGISKSIASLCRLQKYALFGMEEVIEVRMLKRRKPECAIVPLSHPVTTIHLTMATARRNPFWGLINYHLQKLLLNGVIARLKLSEFPPLDRLKDNTEREVGLRQLISAFVFILFFMCLSVLILLLEIQHHGYVTSRRKRKRLPMLIQKPRIISEHELKIYKKLHSVS